MYVSQLWSHVKWRYQERFSWSFRDSGLESSCDSTPGLGKPDRVGHGWNDCVLSSSGRFMSGLVDY